MFSVPVIPSICKGTEENEQFYSFGDIVNLSSFRGGEFDYIYKIFCVRVIWCFFGRGESWK